MRLSYCSTMIKHGVTGGQENETMDESVILFGFQADHLNSGSLWPVMLKKGDGSK